MMLEDSREKLLLQKAPRREAGSAAQFCDPAFNHLKWNPFS